MLENQVGEQDHAAANVWGIQVGKLATQQIGDELQLQKKRVQYSEDYYARNNIKDLSTTNVSLLTHTPGSYTAMTRF